ncbi:MAG: prepilin-type N-terminal cleavage/methylation domain-containing protein [Candidatus Omnitrophota bacterium]
MFKKQGFTLVEVILVIVIVGILAAIVIPRITYSSTAAKTQACNANVASLNSQVELYHVQEIDGWPTALDNLTSKDYIDAIPTCPYATAYTFNTTTHRVPKHSH